MKPMAARSRERGFISVEAVLCGRTCWLILGLALSLLGFAIGAQGAPPWPAVLTWEELPALPDPIGLGGMYAGVSHGALIAAGGANFPDKPSWEDGQKAWCDTIYVLENPGGVWRVADERLPRPRAYGVSVTYNNSVICIGGMDHQQCYSDVFKIEWADGNIRTTWLPPLPRPCGYACGALVGTRVYVAGGLPDPKATKCLRTFWALDLSKPAGQMRWEQLEAWPGPERMLAVAGAQDGAFFLLSGRRVEKDSNDAPRLVTPDLRDAYWYRPARGAQPGVWRRIADLPRPVVGAPSPAIALGQSLIAVPGGVDQSTLKFKPHEHPGFPPEIHVYHTVTNTWTVRGQLPAGGSRVTAPVAAWEGGWVIVSGERSPGLRSPKVFRARAAERER